LLCVFIVVHYLFYCLSSFVCIGCCLIVYSVLSIWYHFIFLQVAWFIVYDVACGRWFSIYRMYTWNVYHFTVILLMNRKAEEWKLNAFE
jgi:hypothetical protein